MEGSEGGSNGDGGDGARPWQSYHTVYTIAKAGMERVDKEKVQRIVYEMSKGSKYFQNEEKKEALIRQKIHNLRLQCAKLTQADLSHYQKVADRRILDLEASRDLSRIWLHVDMDAFYAAVETLCNPTLKGRPMAVGSMSMISTANYERYDPNFIAGSLDEAYLDITEVCKKRNTKSEEIAQELRASVYEETGLTCSAGVAPNRLLAKVCSDINKPNGQYVLPNERVAIMAFISSLPIRKIGGIGKVTENILKEVFGINTCEQMLEKASYLGALFSQSTADFFYSVGLGLGKTDSPQVRFRKSISNERTFSATEDEVLLYKRLAELAEMLSADMQKEGLCGRTLTLKLKTASFEVRTRAVTLQKYISSSEDILKHASNLLKAELPISVRLIGLRISQFNGDKCGDTSDPTQTTITSFITCGEANKKYSSSPDVTDHDLVGDTETELSLDNRQTSQHDCIDLFDGNHSLDVDYQSCTVWKNDSAEEVQTSSNDATSSNYNGYREELGPTSFQGQFEVINVNNGSKSNRLEDERPSSSCQETTMLWVNDYKCSLCGIELPPSFVEERLEHSDFHLAEKLQKEESRIHQTSVPSQCRDQKYRVTGKSKSKKQKLSQKEGSANGDQRQHHLLREAPFAHHSSVALPLHKDLQYLLTVKQLYANYFPRGSGIDVQPHAFKCLHMYVTTLGLACMFYNSMMNEVVLGRLVEALVKGKLVRGWWKDFRNQYNEKAETSQGREQRDEKSQTKPDDNTFERRDGFSERKVDPPPTSRKRPSFREKKILVESGDANPAATVAVKSSQIDHPPVRNERKEERSSNPHHLHRPEKQFTGDRAPHKGEARRDGFPSRGKYRGNDNYRGRDKFIESHGYHPTKTQTEKWKHDLYQEVNKDTVPQNEDDQIARVEALLAS
ncbi:UmuC domain [Sesbania bispinosa]|nr:UmuC domain [Sesbania bispinosa]